MGSHIWSPFDFILCIFYASKISKLGVTLEAVMSHGYMHMKILLVHMKEQPKISVPKRAFFRMMSLSAEWRHLKCWYFQIKFFIKVTLYMIYAYQSVTHTTWFIPHIKAHTLKITLDKNILWKCHVVAEESKTKKSLKRSIAPPRW